MGSAALVSPFMVLRFGPSQHIHVQQARGGDTQTIIAKKLRGPTVMMTDLSYSLWMGLEDEN